MHLNLKDLHLKILVSGSFAPQEKCENSRTEYAYLQKAVPNSTHTKANSECVHKLYKLTSLLGGRETEYNTLVQRSTSNGPRNMILPH